MDSTALDHVQTALREKEQEKRNRIASIDGSRGAGGVGRRPRVSKSVADGWDPAPPGQGQPGTRTRFTPSSPLS